MTYKLQLDRFAYLPELTLGWLTAPQALPDFRLATIEPPWIPRPDGRPGGCNGRSCVPDGVYELWPHDGTQYKNVYALVGEDLGVYHWSCPAGQSWGRTAILIHVANLVREIEGCIAVGMEHGRLYGSRAVLKSSIAMNKLRPLLGRERHELLIQPSKGTNA